MKPHPVMRSRSMSSHTTSGSNRPTVQTDFTPLTASAMAAVCRPDTWKSGLVTSWHARGAPSGGGLSIIIRRPWKKLSPSSAPTLRWVLIAPFGRPVVPLVYSRIAASSSSIGWSGNTASGRPRQIASKSSSITIAGTPGSAPSRRARRRRSATSTNGSELSPTAMAPRLIVAQNVTIHSGEFAPRIATRSPGPTP